MKHQVSFRSNKRKYHRIFTQPCNILSICIIIMKNIIKSDFYQA